MSERQQNETILLDRDGRAHLIIQHAPGSGSVRTIRVAHGITVEGNSEKTILGQIATSVVEQSEAVGRAADQASEAIIDSVFNGNVQPPSLADILLALFLNEAKADAIIGDLSERFARDCQRYGAARAHHLYWTRAIRSLWPLLRRATARAMRLAAFAEAVRRFFNG